MATRRIELADEAKTELRAAFDWYRERNLEHRPNSRRVVGAIDLLADEADTYPLFEKGVRRALLPNFPSGVLYEVVGDVVFVIAVAHLRRRPGYWK